MASFIDAIRQRVANNQASRKAQTGVYPATSGSVINQPSTSFTPMASADANSTYYNTNPTVGLGVKPVVSETPTVTPDKVQEPTIDPNKQAIDNILNKSGTTLDQWMANYKSPYDSSKYIADASNLAKLNSNLKYDSIADDLKNRVANIIAGLNTQIGKLPAKYNPHQVQANTDEVATSRMLRDALAKRGMVGSGVDNGYQAQNANTYSQQRTDIGLQQAQEETDLNNQITQNNQTMNQQLNAIGREKGDYVASQIAEAQQRLDAMEREARANYEGNYFKQQGLDLQKDANAVNALLKQGDQGLEGRKIDINVDQFDKTRQDKNTQFELTRQDEKDRFRQTMGFNYDELESNEKTFYAKLYQDNDQFIKKLEQDEDQFAKQLGFNREQLKEEIRQFDMTDKREREALDKKLAIDYAKMASDERIASADRASRERMAMAEINEYNEAMSGTMFAGIPQKLVPVMAEVNKDLDNKVMDLIGAVGDKKLDNDTAYRTAIGLVTSSVLSEKSTWKETKLEQIKNIFGMKQVEEQKKQLEAKTSKWKYYDTGSGSNTPKSVAQSVRGN